VTQDQIRSLLEAVASGALAPGDAAEKLRVLSFEDVGFARIDHHREVRCGFPEVIFGAGKTAEQFLEIFNRLADRGGNILATRVRPRTARRVLEVRPEAVYDRTSRTLTLRQKPPQPASGYVAIVCAGTADIPVAEEARITSEMMDQPTRCAYDCGVAGVHRILAEVEMLRGASAVVVVAGMDGALPSVVGGLVASPVIAVPTRVGYGANLAGIAPLLTMLNSCAAGVSVVNIDNGFGAGYQAALINRLRQNAR
jgi:NCAIR mutase (PurE)-related protein